MGDAFARYLPCRNSARPLFGDFTQPPGEVGDPRIGRRVELLAEQGCVNPRMPQGPGLVVRRRERTHQRSRDARVERIECGEVAPPRDRRFVFAPRGRCRRQRLGRPARTLLQPRTLGLHPPLELGRLGDEEPVEERPRVDTDCRF